MSDTAVGEPIWEVEGRPEFAQLDGDARCDVCVVGLGGSGLSAIHELLEAGADVIGVDAKTVAAGAAGRNGGFLLAGLAAFHHVAARELGEEKAATLHRLTSAELERLARQHPQAVRRTGSLRIADSATELADCEEQARVMRRSGLDVEDYVGPEGEGLLFPADCSFDPLRRCREAALGAAARGAHLHEHTPAEQISGSEVVTARGTVSCGAVIVAVDGGLERLLPEASGEVRTARLQMLATAPTVEVELPRPVYRRFGYEYYQQLPSGSVALGGFRDRAGAAEWTFDAAPTAAVQDRLELYLREVVGVRAPITHRWAASVGFSRSLLPLCAQVRQGVWALGGYSGTGNVVGSLLGRAVARAALGGSSPVLDSFYCA